MYYGIFSGLYMSVGMGGLTHIIIDVMQNLHWKKLWERDIPNAN